MKNNSWYLKWLAAKGNRLYDLKNQIDMTDANIHPEDYAMMDDHYLDLAHDSSVVHFYFNNLYNEEETAFEAVPPIGNVIFSIFWL